MPDRDLADDGTVQDSDILWRRIPPHHLIYDDNRGTIRASKGAFDDHPKGCGMSVVIASQSLREGRGPERILGDEHGGYSVKSFTARLARRLGQRIIREPVDEEPAHAVIFGRKTESRRKAFAKESKWVVRSFDTVALDSLLNRYGDDAGQMLKIRQCFDSRIEWQ